jgi:hypothetical protein
MEDQRTRLHPAAGAGFFCSEGVAASEEVRGQQPTARLRWVSDIGTEGGRAHFTEARCVFVGLLSRSAPPVQLRSVSRLGRPMCMPRKNKPNRCADCLTVLCPTTLSSIPTTIATDVRTLAKAWHSKIKVSCPHCGAVHTYRVSEAFVEAAISYARLRGDVAQLGLSAAVFSRL